MCSADMCSRPIPLLLSPLCLFMNIGLFWIIASAAVVHAHQPSTPPQSAGVLLKQAKDYEAAQQFREAASAYRDYLALRPDDDEVRRAWARVLSWQGDYAAAVGGYRDIVSRHPADLDTRTALARVLSWQQQVAEAQTLYEAVLQDEPQHVEALRGLADLLLWTGRLQDALRRYESVFLLTHDPEVGQRIATIQSDVDKVQAGYTQPLTDPVEVADRDHQGHGAWNGPRQALVDPDDRAARADLARRLSADGQYDQAVGHYQALLARDPADVEIQVALARVLSWQRHYDEAERLYRTVLEVAPVHQEARQGLADLLSWTNRVAEALPLYEEVYRTTQDSAVRRRVEDLQSERRAASRLALDEQVLHAREQAWNKQYEQAIQSYRAVLVQDPGHAEAKQGLADTLYWSSQYEEALALYQAVYAETNHPALSSRIQAVQSELMLPPRAPLARGAGLAIPFRDYLKMGYSHYSYTNQFPDERNGLIEGAKPLGNMTVVGRVEPLNRFGLQDTPMSGELYSPLWSRAWGYLAGSGAVNAQFVPAWSMGGELFQGLGVLSSRLSFLEVSAGYKRMAFRTADIDLVTPGVTIYLPWNLWLTEKIVYVPRQGSITASTQVTWRPRERWQFYVSGAHGTSGERIQAVQDFVRVKSTIWQAGMIFPLTARLSAEASGYYEDRGFLYIRRGVTFNVLWHW